jgi:hypothetical protein
MRNMCFSRSGWWQTLCGLDAANQGFGWSSYVPEVECRECKALIKKGEHRRWKKRHVLKSMRKGAKRRAPSVAERTK